MLSQAFFGRDVDDLFLIGEVTVRGPDADTGVPCDVVERDTESLVGEQLAPSPRDVHGSPMRPSATGARAAAVP